MSRSVGLWACLGVMWVWGTAAAQDWPMWRYDAGHSAAGLTAVSDALQLEWTRTASPRRQVWDDPLNHDLMPYDRVFEPIAKDGVLFVGFNDTDKMVAVDLSTGREKWTFFTDGPVRFPAVAWQDYVFFCSDDSVLYCVNASDGQLRWKYHGAPGARKAIGNQRMISAWPARGGPVVNEGRVYFAASIWPLMGTFIYCLDATTGDPLWVNDSTSAQYIKQPHSAPSFAGVAPQGTLTITGDYLLVPGGRSVPAAFNLATGEFRHFLFNEGGKGNGGSLVLAQGQEFYVHTRRRGVRAFELVSGNKTAFMTNEPVLADHVLYAAEIKLPPKPEKTAAKADGGEEEEGGEAEPSDPAKLPGAVPVIRAYATADKRLLWELPAVDGTGDLIKAGDRLYAAGNGQLTVLECPADGTVARVVKSIPVEGNVQRLIAASGKLIAVTLEGTIHCLGDSGHEPIRMASGGHDLPTPQSTETVDQLLRQTGARDGYLLYFGPADEALLDALLARSKFELVVVDENTQRVDELRRRYDAAGLYGHRISLHVGDIHSFQAPPYVAPLVLISGSAARQVSDDPSALRRAYESVRPYGGCLAVIEPAGVVPEHVTAALQKAQLEQAAIESDGVAVVARRVGALPDSADWTHQYGDVANTVKSNDARVKLPLGILWFGGTSNLDILPRHGHGPPEQVVGGRLFVEGMNSLSCQDVYTGRTLWKREFANLGTFNIYYDDTYKDTPLDPAYNQVHIPGANGRGTNVVATEDGVYILEGSECHVLNVETGETMRKIAMPKSADAEDQEWAYLGIYRDVLIGGAGFARYSKRGGFSVTDLDAALRDNAKGFGFKSLETSASASLVAFDRHTGEVLWQVKPRHSFINNGIVAGDGLVFCLDKIPQLVEDQLRRRGIAAPDTYRIVAFDAQTGETRWEFSENIFGTWLGYSEQYHLLLHAGAAASDRLKSEVGQGMAVLQGDTGQVVWRVDDRAYSGPCILHNDTILTNANSYKPSSGAFSLLDGQPKLVVNPLTKQEQPWQLNRAYGCNSIVACENFLTFRSGAAGFYDLKTASGTGNFGGFKSGCTSNLIVANGVLNAPDYTRTCSCGYQNQTSLALVHMPEMDMWTVNYTAQLSTPGASVQRVGVNFGAPGDRIDAAGTLWVDYPVVGGESVELDIKVTGEPRYYHRNSLGFAGPGTPWVGASGVANVSSLSIPLTVKHLPDEMRFRVKSSDDDTEEQADGTVSPTSTDLEFVQGESTQVVGLRFADVQLPGHRKIEAAHLQFTCDETSDAETAVTIAAVDETDAAPFTASVRALSNRITLADAVAWKIPAWDKADRAAEAERSPDVTEQLRRIVSRADWREGNALAFIVRGNGKRIAKSFDGSPDAAPELVLRVEAEPPTNVPTYSYTVRLIFAEPESVSPGERVFDIQLGEQIVEQNFDIVQVAGGPRKTIVREYPHVMLSDKLTLTFAARQGQPIISGVEIIRE